MSRRELRLHQDATSAGFREAHTIRRERVDLPPEPTLCDAIVDCRSAGLEEFRSAAIS